MNWVTITLDDLKATGHGDIIDVAQTTAAGTTDPVVEAIADAIAKIRGAISVGNALDADTTKIPRSLKSLGERIALFALMERIQLALNDDQRDTKRNDQSYLNRVIDSKIRFETPDSPAGNGEMQSAGGIETISGTDRTNYTREGLNGL